MNFFALSLTVNIVLFLVATVAVWIAGTLVTRYADAIAERTGIGHVLAGLFLLAGITSLPEIATSFTAAYQGDAKLAVTAVLGSIAMPVAILAVGDLIYSKRALTSVVPDPGLMLQGSLNVILLLLVAMAIVAGDTGLWGAGIWTWGLFIAVIYSFVKLWETDDREPWIANTDSDVKMSGKRRERGSPVRFLTTKTVACSLVILVAGYLLARSGEAISVQTGIGSSFMGMAFLAIATSLPEASTVFAAMRHRFYSMAIADIFGTNILNVALVFGADLIAGGSPVLNRVGAFSVFAALLGALLTGLYLMGLAERRDRAFLRMGIDSLLVLVFYLVGMVLLYRL